MRLDTDMDVVVDEDALDLGVLKPFGHFVYPARSLALISQAFGGQGFFDSEEEAMPVLRMKARLALQGKSRFDFRLYRWDRELLAWFVAVRTIEFGSKPAKKEVVHA